MASDAVANGEYGHPEGVPYAGIVDLFAGPGGWDEGLRLLGREDVVGLELDLAACQTATAAGHRRILTDVAHHPPERFAGCEGLIASPPCQDWSTAGGMAREGGSSGHLVRQVRHWVDVIRPQWVACEQVPQALPVWEEHAVTFRSWGYRTWTGILDAADFGVPQNRLRAFLLASIDGLAHPPAPTHAEGDQAGLFGTLAPAVTLADVIGLEPGWHYDSGQNSRGPGGTIARYRRSCDRPAGTLTTKSVSQWILRRDSDRRKLTTADALAIQTFRPDFPLHGNATDRQRQIGNAVPPLFAAHVLASVSGCGLSHIGAAA